MGHWFDDLTKQLATGKVSRRAVMQGAIGASVLPFLGAPADDVSPLPKYSPNIVTPQAPTQQAVGVCTVRQEQVRTFSLSTQAEWRGRQLEYEQTATVVVPAGNATFTRRISLDGNTLFATEAIRKPSGATKISIRFGPILRGIQEAIFTSDGEVFVGRIDGRPVLPFRKGADYRSLVFTDGQPAPSSDVPDEIKRAIELILQKARREAPSCLQTEESRRSSISTDGRSLPSFTIQRVGSAGERFSDPAVDPYSIDLGPSMPLPLPHGDHGHGSHPSWSGGCKACEGACAGGAIACALACAGGCAGATIFYLVCLIPCELGCVVAQVGCMVACHACGGPCCPVCCGNVACCDRGETCLNPSTGVCCSEGLVPCANHSCCQPTDTCIPSDGTCCPAGQVVCSNVCCKPGELCKEGICCPKDQIICANVCCGPKEKCVSGKCCPTELACGNVCCDELTRCVNPGTGLCCSFASETCGTRCCPPGERCIQGQCCPSNQLCGGTCCPPGFPCQDPVKGICSSKPCSRRQKPCNPEPPGPGICCPENVGSCCNGQCCQPNEICCSRTGLPFGCHHPAECVA